MAEKIQFMSEPARDGNLYMNAVTISGRVRLNSNYRPIQEAEKWASALPLAKQGAIVLMFGIGNGYCLRELLARLPKDAAVLAYEPSAELCRHVKEHYSIKDVLSDRRFRLVVAGENDAQLYIYLDQLIHWSNAKKQCFCYHPQYDKLFPEQLAHFEEVIRANNVRIYTNRNTEMHFGQAIAENVANNLRFVPQAGTFKELIGKIHQEIPAVLVAAGPSLDKNIEELKRAKGKAFIIAVDTAMRALHAHGILPDAVVTIDAKIREKHFLDTDFAKIPLFAKQQSNYRVLQMHQAEKIWFDSHDYLKRFYAVIGRKNQDYHAGASVATAAFSICAALKLKRIILIGQDLAYLGDVTHVGGEISKIRAEQENICYVDAVDGGKIKTRHDWLQYLRWFERVIQEVREEIEVIDATEGGALIHGAVLMPLAKAIDKYCKHPFDFQRVLHENLRPLDRMEKEQFAQYIEESKEEAKRLKRIALEICSICERKEAEIKEAVAADKDLYYTQCMEQLHQEIAKRNKVIQKMNFYLLADDYTKQVSIPAITNLLEYEGTKEECYLLGLAENKHIYQALAEAVDALYPLLESI